MHPQPADQTSLKTHRPARPAPSDGSLFAPGRAPATYYADGAEIYAQGDRSQGLFKVEFGAVRIFRLLADGRRQISAFHLAGDVFGLESTPTHRFFAEAIGATAIHAFRFGGGADMSRDILPLALSSLAKAQEHLLVLGRQNASERVAAFLLDVAERQGGLDQFDLPMSRLDIADYLGLTIETVSRVLSKFKARGVIRLRSLRQVEVRNWDMLRHLAE